MVGPGDSLKVSGFPRSRIRLWARAPEAESCDLDENTVLDLDASGGICGITVEHAKVRADLPQCSFEQVGV